MNEFKFSIPMTVRIGDINYGNHVGYHVFLLYFQEARIAYLNKLGFSELDIAGHGMVVGAVECKYKKELLMGDRFEVECRISELRSKAFTMEYRVVKDQTVHTAGSTINLCFDPRDRKVTRLPQAFVDAVRNFEGISADGR